MGEWDDYLKRLEHHEEGLDYVNGFLRPAGTDNAAQDNWSGQTQTYAHSLRDPLECDTLQ